MNTEIRGKNIVLREQRIDDAKFFVYWFNQPQIMFQCGFTEPTDEENEKNVITVNHKTNDSIWYTITDADGNLIGETGLLRMWPVWHCTDLSIIIPDPQMQRKGYGTEVINLMLDLAFHQYDMNRVAIGVVGRNTKALNFYKKIGFKQEGIQEQGYYYNNEYSDFIMMRILRCEWEDSRFQEISGDKGDMMREQGRVEIVRKFYEAIDEHKRLETKRQGQLEYFVTMNYIHKYIKEGDRILDIGAGTGRYSIALAKEGYQVSAIELVEKNLKEMKAHAKRVTNLTAVQGDALDLSRFEDASFDMTLLFGPMYHLYDETDQHKALDEAIRVTKPNGIILVAFLSAHAIICTNYLYDFLPTRFGLKENFDSEYRVKHFKEQLFTGFDICEFEDLFLNKAVEHLTTVAVDNVLEIAEARPDFVMTDEDFAAFADYQMHICEKREMLGHSSHLLYICRKNNSCSR